MIHQLSVEGFKCLRKVMVPLGPLTVLVGPNDSGKTSILDALFCLGQTTTRPLFGGQDEKWDVTDGPWSRSGAFDRRGRGAPIFAGDWSLDRVAWGGHGPLPRHVRLAVKGVAADGPFDYGVHLRTRETPNQGPRLVMELLGDAEGRERMRFDREKWMIWRNHGLYQDLDRAQASAREQYENSTAVRVSVQRGEAEFAALAATLSTSEKLRWDPRLLALPAPVSLEGGMRPDGFGLASALDELRDQLSSQEWLELEAALARHVPTVSGIRFSRKPIIMGDRERDGKILEVLPAGCDKPVPASQASDGVLMTIAYLQLVRRPNPPAVILLEEPEKGLHPRRIGCVITLLRDLTMSSLNPHPPQLLITTHNPLVLNLLDPSEALLVTRDPAEGTVVTPFLTSEAAHMAKEAFDLGELWYNVGDEALARHHE